MDLAEHLVALVHRADNDAHGGEVVDLVERLVLVLHLLVDGIEVLGAAEHLAVDVALLENAVDLLDHEVDEAVALLQLLMDVLDEVLERGGIEVFQA